jgi:hypothetical protein
LLTSTEMAVASIPKLLRVRGKRRRRREEGWEE